ncbi:hypothetical protein BLNAU_5247 [Blattamonas nauphoetae]|uniref:Uncharacterized protein n=1 Tax=Blattamonas nauphoetae TaxID=2049346 RepID=A0ABQ9Y7L9_9EUKA|nr:hypothetical protein BLNAU_5247 [Blattamonas nauphoetae]
MDLKTVEPWLKGFLYLLGRVSEGTQFSDLGTLVLAIFLRHHPSPLELYFYSDDKFGLKMKDTIVSSSPLDTKSLWRLFSPTQPHHAVILLPSFSHFLHCRNDMTFEKHIWSGWFPSFVNGVDPSKLPFTADCIPFHTKLFIMLRDRLAMIRRSENAKSSEFTDQQRSELDETYRAFYPHTGLCRPFVSPSICFGQWLDVHLDDFRNNMTKAYREDARKAIDASALALSSPPFILTSQLICHLTDDEIIDIVDRIVALLESDSCLDDDINLRICAFHKHQLSRIHLPNLFRQAGRSTEPFFHAFECLLSLPIDYFDQAPINHLISNRWLGEQTFNEWDDVDLEKFAVVKRMITLDYLSEAFIKHIVEDIVQRQWQIRHCASRLSQSQFERLIAPSVDFLSQFFIHPPNSTWRESQERKQQFVDVCKLCDKRMIARSFSRTGFFSRFVTALFDNDCSGTVSCFQTIIDRSDSPEISIEDIIAIQRRISNFVEEGLQDASEFLFVKKYVASYTAHDMVEQMMKFYGANFNGLRG